MNTVPGPGRSMATSALSIPAAMPPWATRRPNRVRAANAASKCSGLRSPVICAYSSTSRSVTVWVRVARWPTRSPSGPTAGSAPPCSALIAPSSSLPAAGSGSPSRRQVRARSGHPEVAGLHVVVAGELGRGALVDGAAPAQDLHAVGHREGERQVLLDEQDAEP